MSLLSSPSSPLASSSSSSSIASAKREDQGSDPTESKTSAVATEVKHNSSSLEVSQGSSLASRSGSVTQPSDEQRGSFSCISRCFSRIFGDSGKKPQKKSDEKCEWTDHFKNQIDTLSKEVDEMKEKVKELKTYIKTRQEEIRSLSAVLEMPAQEQVNTVKVQVHLALKKQMKEQEEAQKAKEEKESQDAVKEREKNEFVETIRRTAIQEFLQNQIVGKPDKLHRFLGIGELQQGLGSYGSFNPKSSLGSMPSSALLNAPDRISSFSNRSADVQELYGSDSDEKGEMPQSRPLFSRVPATEPRHRTHGTERTHSTYSSSISAPPPFLFRNGNGVSRGS